MTKQEFITWAKSKGYTDSGRGSKNIRLISPDTQTSFRISKIAVRYEVKVKDVGWTRLQSNYLKNLSVGENGKLKGLKR